MKKSAISGSRYKDIIRIPTIIYESEDGDVWEEKGFLPDLETPINMTICDLPYPIASCV